MTEHSAKKIVIVGGSLGGLFAGIILVRLGFNVVILERIPANILVDQGAGIALVPIVPPILEAFQNLGTSGGPIVDFFAEYDRTKTEFHIKDVDSFQYLKRDSTVKSSTPAPPGYPGGCSWDLLYNILRANFDGGYSGYVNAAARKDGDGKATYLSGVRVNYIKDLGDIVEVIHDGGVLLADFVIGADGSSSRVRKLLLPKSERKYTGYVAFRGTVKESELSEPTNQLFGENLTVYHRKAIQALVYRIPGANGSLEKGERLVNMVWYCNIEDTKEILTDATGVTHRFSLGIGKIRSEVKEKQRRVASTLPPPLTETFEKIQSPFIQAITDNLATKAVFMEGKVVLLGDALAGLRPHSTAGTSQAVMHALLLKKVFDGSMSIEEWEKKSLSLSTLSQTIGVQMGTLSQFGQHPQADD